MKVTGRVFPGGVEARSLRSAPASRTGWPSQLRMMSPPMRPARSSEVPGSDRPSMKTPPPSAVEKPSTSALIELEGSGCACPAPPLALSRTDLVTMPDAVRSTINKITHVIHPARLGLHALAQFHAEVPPAFLIGAGATGWRGDGAP